MEVTQCDQTSTDNFINIKEEICSKIEYKTKLKTACFYHQCKLKLPSLYSCSLTDVGNHVVEYWVSSPAIYEIRWTWVVDAENGYVID